MRVPPRRTLVVMLLPLALVVQPTRAAEQQPSPRIFTLTTEPLVLTKLEALLATPGVLLTTDFYAVDTRFGPNVALDAVVASDIDRRTKVKGLRIRLRDETKPEPRSGLSFVDLDEAVSLSQALTSMAGLAANWTGREDQRSTDVSFRTVGGFSVGVHESGRGQSAFLSSGYTDPVRTAIEIGGFATLKLAVDQALGVLADK
jgi:hypothetical protein